MFFRVKAVWYAQRSIAQNGTRQNRSIVSARAAKRHSFISFFLNAAKRKRRTAASCPKYGRARRKRQRCLFEVLQHTKRHVRAIRHR
eukprot:IDg2052t1